MKVLGVDTATSCGGIGIIDDDRIVAEHTFGPGDAPSATLIRAMQTILDGSGLDLGAIEGIAISLGPGSFTGVRVGLSAVKGLALATGRPVVGVPTLDALASQLPRTPYLICPLLDARKGEVYVALYKQRVRGDVERLTPYQVLSPAALLAEISSQETTFLGDGAEVYRELITGHLGERAFFAPSHLRFLHGTTVATLGLKRIKRGERDDIASLVPLYVRPSEAELKGAHKEYCA
jgi:tRNA threonylcarbamoyladenosine biosynthesis protein TsaB